MIGYLLVSGPAKIIPPKGYDSARKPTIKTS